MSFLSDSFDIAGVSGLLTIGGVLIACDRRACPAALARAPSRAREIKAPGSCCQGRRSCLRPSITLRQLRYKLQNGYKALILLTFFM